MNPIDFDSHWEGLASGQESKSSAGTVDRAAPSIVQVHFPGQNRTLSYYNSRFCLHVGDIVFVDGRLEGEVGRVVGVNTHFKIRVEDYKQVVSVADTHVTGQFYPAGAYFVTFDPQALPFRKFLTWVKPEEETEYYIHCDGEGFALENLSGLGASKEILARGIAYWKENRVRYLSLDGSTGRAVVEGTWPYEVEFQYQDGVIRDLLCDCPCGYACKHEAAVLLQLKETLARLEEEHAER